MLIPKFTLKYLSIGSGSIIGKDNIEEFFNHVSKHEDTEDRSLAELAPNYEMTASSLIHMLEARFVNLNPLMQVMFLKLKEIEDPEKRDFILETLFKEFYDVAKEARKVFECFNMIGSCVDVVGTREKMSKTEPNGEEIKIPIPFKLVAMHEVMTHKYRGCIAVFSREVKPNLLIRHKGSQRIFISLNNELSIQLHLETILLTTVYQ